MSQFNPRTSNARGGGGESNGPPIGFSGLKLKRSSNQNETFTTCSLIMSASFDVNWMTSSLIIYAKLIMQIKVQNRKL